MCRTAREQYEWERGPWVTMVGEEILVSQMSDEHLSAAIASFEWPSIFWRKDWWHRMTIEREIRDARK